MQTYPLTFAGAGERVQLNVPGRYLVLLRLDTNPVNIELFWRGRKLDLGTITNWTTGPLAGLEIGPLPTLDPSGAAFDRVEIVSTGADTCVLGIGDGTVRYNRSQGSVALTSPLLTDNADAQAAGAQSGLQAIARLQGFNGATFDRLRSMADNGDAVAALALGLLRTGAMNFGFNGATWDRLRADNIGGAGALRVTDRGIAYGSGVVNTTASAANNPIPLVTSGANVNGMIVWRCSFSSLGAGAGHQAVILAKNANPAGVTDGDPICGPSGSDGAMAHGSVETPTFVSAGKGLFIIGSTNETSKIATALVTLL